MNIVLNMMETSSIRFDSINIKYFPRESPHSKKKIESLYDMSINIAIVALPAIISMAFSLLI